MLKSVQLGLQSPQNTSEAQMLRTLNTFAVDLMSIPSVEDLFWYVAQNVVGKLGFLDCVIYQANEAHSELTQVSAWGEKNPYGRNIINPMVIPFGRGITGQVAQSGKPIIIDDLGQDENYIADTQPARSEICVPLIISGRIVGVIDSEHPNVGAFGDTELELLSTVAAMMSAKLELLEEANRSHDRYDQLVTAHARLTQEISVRKTLEAKLAEARNLEAVGRMAGRFAHEFNNLLTVISGNLELLELGGPDGETRAQLVGAISASARGADLIRDMLAFAQRTRLTPKTLDLNASILAFCETSMNLLNHEFELSLSNDLWMVSADPAAIENILMNLTLNAVDAAPDSGRIRLATENVFHMLSDERPAPPELVPGRYVRLSVTDEGAGIVADHLPQVFDPFFTTKEPGEGTGLGLSMVLGVMRQSGGTVTVRSEVGRGTTFELYFPALAGVGNDSLTINR